MHNTLVLTYYINMEFRWPLAPANTGNITELNVSMYFSLNVSSYEFSSCVFMLKLHSVGIQLHLLSEISFSSPFSHRMNHTMLRSFSVQCWKTGRDVMTLRDDVVLSTRLFLKKCVVLIC